MYGNLTAKQIALIELIFKMILESPLQLQQKAVMAEVLFQLLASAYAEGTIEDLRIWTIFCRVLSRPHIYPEDLSLNVWQFLFDEHVMASGTCKQYIELSDMVTY